MHRIPLQPDFQAWRIAARQALHAGFLPTELDLPDASVPRSLALTLDADDLPTGHPIRKPRVPRRFLASAAVVALHRDPERWNLLYRILYRVQRAPKLMQQETDADVGQLLRLEAQVRRDLHQMQATVHFRKVLAPDDPSDRPVVLDESIPIDPDPHAHRLVLATPTPFGPVRSEIAPCPPPDSRANCDHYVAWYAPEQRILPLAAPSFAERYSILRWTILTPEASVSWDPATKKLAYAQGFPLETPRSQQRLEALWRIHVTRTANPASTLV